MNKNKNKLKSAAIYRTLDDRVYLIVESTFDGYVIPVTSRPLSAASTLVWPNTWAHSHVAMRSGPELARKARAKMEAEVRVSNRAAKLAVSRVYGNESRVFRMTLRNPKADHEESKRLVADMAASV